MAQEDGYFQYGNVVSPITNSLLNSSLKDCDPILYNLIRYYVGVIQLHVGRRWDAEMTALGLPEYVGKVVAQAISYDPLPFAPENSLKFPLLTIYREKESYGKRTTNWFSVDSTISVIYVLPPLTTDQYNRVSPILTHIARVLQDRTAEGSDTNYLNGQEVWKQSGLDQIGCGETTYGKIPGLQKDNKSEIWFPCFMMTVELKERSDPYKAQFEPFTQADVEIDSVDNVNPPVDLVNIQVKF